MTQIRQMTADFIFDRRTKEQVFGLWVVSNEPWAYVYRISMRRENVGTSACSVRGFYSRKSRQRIRTIPWDSWDYNPMFRTIGYAIRWNWGGDLQSPSMLSGHRPLYSKTANNIFAVTERHVFLFWFLCSYVYSWYSWYYNSCVLFGRCTQRPYPLMTHFSSLTTQNVLLFFCRKNSQLITHNSPLKIASTFCKTTNLLSDNQKVALSLGRSERNLYFCSI